MNGLFPTIPLPASANPQQVVAECLGNARFDKYAIAEVRDVTIPSAPSTKYSAILADSNLGRKIVLLQYVGPSNGWWTRIYDAK
jgi:hypothetical protein